MSPQLKAKGALCITGTSGGILTDVAVTMLKQ